MSKRKTAPGSAPDMTLDDVAEYLGVTRRTIQNMVADGRLQGYCLGR